MLLHHKAVLPSAVEFSFGLRRLVKSAFFIVLV